MNSKNIHCYVVGEHGDSSFALWSKSYIGTIPILDKVSIEDLDSIMIETRNLGYKIEELKGETSSGIGMALLTITKSILKDENLILTVSSPVEDIYISTPSLIGKTGIKGVMKINFNDEERILFEDSKKVIRTAIENMED